VTDAARPESATPTATRLAEFLVRAGAMLLSCACPSHRVEETLSDLARRFGYVADVFSVPSGIWLAVSRPGDHDQVVRIARVGSWSMALDRLAAVDAIFDDVVSGHLSMDDAESALARVERQPRSYGPMLEWLAGALAAASAVLLYGGRWFEALMGAGIGVGFTVLASFFSDRNNLRHLTPFFAGALATAVAWLAAEVEPELATQPLIIAGVILFVPGTALTVGLNELVQKNLVSGTGRLLDATMTLLSIVFGVMLVAALAHALGSSPDFLTRRHAETVPFPVLVLATAVAGLSFSVLVAVPVRYLLWGARELLLRGSAEIVRRLRSPLNPDLRRRGAPNIWGCTPGTAPRCRAPPLLACRAHRAARFGVQFAPTL
jgi:uncharacterized membrane protein YjjP (DUF1212 family)